MTNSNSSLARDLARAIVREVSYFESVESTDIRRLEDHIKFLCRWAQEGQVLKLNFPPWRMREALQE